MPMQRIRLSTFLTSATRKARYIAAVKKMKTDGVYQIFVDWHEDASVAAMAHGNLCFLVWHRVFIRLFEKKMQEADRALNPSLDEAEVLSLPYWDYNNLDSSDPLLARGAIWKDDFMGAPAASGAWPRAVATGPFAGTANWEIKNRTNSISTDPPTYTVSTQSSLLRSMGNLFTGFPSLTEITAVLGIPTYDDNKFLRVRGHPEYEENSTNNSFRAVLEGFAFIGPMANPSRLHNGVHGWVGGTMGSPPIAPNDPIFWIHHCMIDRMYAQWQFRNPALSQQWPESVLLLPARTIPGPNGITNPNAIEKTTAMIPWTTASKNWQRETGATVITTQAYTPEHAFKWFAMGSDLGSYQYDDVGTSSITF